MKQPIRVRQQMLQNPEFGELFRDIQRAFDSMPTELLRKIEMMYTEPLVLGHLEQEPESIELVRIIDLANQDTPVVNAGGICQFSWLPAEGGAHIKSINGLSLAANGGKKYRLTFRLTYAPVAGFNV